MPRHPFRINSRPEGLKLDHRSLLLVPTHSPHSSPLINSASFNFRLDFTEMLPAPTPQRPESRKVDFRRRSSRNKQRARAAPPGKKPPADGVTPSSGCVTEDSVVGPIHRSIPQKRPGYPSSKGQVPHKPKRAKPTPNVNDIFSLETSEEVVVEGTPGSIGDKFAFFLVLFSMSHK